MGEYLLCKILVGILCSTALLQNTSGMRDVLQEVNIKDIVVKEVQDEDKPVLSKYPLVYKKWARISEEWDEIFDYPEKYPENLLNNLKRNPEILDFVYDYPNAALEVNGEMTIKERVQKCPLFIQWDSRWGYVPYGNYNIGISGCGPTCLSMVLYSYLRDESLTPTVLAQKGMDGGYYVPGAGTAWTYLVNVPQEYGINVKQCQILDEPGMVEWLENGGLLVCSMMPGDFTDTGHFILIREYQDGEFFVNDPFSYTNSYKTWDYETLSKQIKQTWCYEYHEEESDSGN